MTSLKDLGNAAFKAQRFSQAIEYYDQYVQQPHHDNKNAYFNLGLCYSKLSQHQKSIEACRSALALDPHYEKAYYRLMKEYMQTGSPYEVFINALHYLRNEKDEESPQVAEARQLMTFYKERFVSRTEQRAKKREQTDEIFTLVEHLAPNLEENADFNEQIDKYPNEWIEEWNEGVQSEDAKWEEIAYVIQELDYDYGVSLAYYYLNQIGNREQKKVVREKIREIRKQMKREEIIKDSDENVGETGESLQEEEWPELEESQKDVALKEDTKTEKTKASTTAQSAKEKQQDIVKADKINKKEELLKQKSQYRKKLVEPQEIPEPKPNTVQNNPKPEEKSRPIENPKSVAKVEAPPAPKPTPKVEEAPTLKSAPAAKTAEQLTQQLYKSYCGALQKSKDIFAQIYRSIFSILSSSHPPHQKGSLLILIKKRTKKFKVIISSLSSNEQAAIFDLLRKNGMEQYAVDFSPAHHTV